MQPHDFIVAMTASAAAAADFLRVHTLVLIAVLAAVGWTANAVVETLSDHPHLIGFSVACAGYLAVVYFGIWHGMTLILVVALWLHINERRSE